VRVENFKRRPALTGVSSAFTGLRTQIGLLNSAQDCDRLVIIAVSHCGKTRWKRSGCPSYRDEMARGSSTWRLMNTRGLMELIALNIGYDMGILSQRIFTMLVIMALVTTVMTGPLVTFLEKHEGWLQRDPRAVVQFQFSLRSISHFIRKISSPKIGPRWLSQTITT